MAVPVGDDPQPMAAAVDGKWPKAGILHGGVATCIERLPEGWPAPLFIEAFYDACEALPQRGVHVPDVHLINRVLAEHQVRD